MGANTVEGEYGRYGRRGLPEGIEVVGEREFSLPEHSITVQKLADRTEESALWRLRLITDMGKFILYRPEQN